VFDKEHVKIYQGEDLILTGQRDHYTGLWHVPVSDSTDTPDLSTKTQNDTHHNAQTTQHCNNAYETQTISELAQHMHAACFSPAKSTFLKAINAGFFATWPSLTHQNAQKHLKKSIATAKGHLDQQRKNIRSTKKQTPQEDDTTITFHPDDAGLRTHYVHAATMEYSSTTGKIYTDLTGRFPVQSRRGNKYLFVLHDYDSNAILAEPLKN